MQLSLEVIKIVIFLSPGIFSMIIIEKLITHKKIDFDRFAIYSILMSFFIYLFHYFFWFLLHQMYVFCKWGSPIISDPKIILYEFLKSQDFASLSEFLTLILVGILISLFVSYSVNNKWINRIGQALHITTKYGDESMWDYFHNNPNTTWVIVRDLKNDLMYFGWIKIFSDDGSECDELILQKVTVYKNSSGELMYEVEEVYIAEDRKNLRIEIHKYQE